jgi:malonyl-CoA O-methyltransferase
MLRHVPSPIKTKQGSLLNLPFADGAFDCVFCVEALEHTVNPEIAVAEICRVLKPGGKVVIIDKNKQCRGALAIESWEQWFDQQEVQHWLSHHCQKVETAPLSEDPKLGPKGLFVVWQGTRR